MPPPIRQVVLLGSGMDARAWRLPLGGGDDKEGKESAAGVAWFDLDSGPVCEIKRAELEGAGAELVKSEGGGGDGEEKEKQSHPRFPLKAASYALVGCDMASEEWVEKLKEAGFDPSRPALFAAEGVSFFLLLSSSSSSSSSLSFHFHRSRKKNTQPRLPFHSLLPSFSLPLLPYLQKKHLTADLLPRLQGSRIHALATIHRRPRKRPPPRRARRARRRLCRQESRGQGAPGPVLLRRPRRPGRPRPVLRRLRLRQARGGGHVGGPAAEVPEGGAAEVLHQGQADLRESGGRDPVHRRRQGGLNGWVERGLVLFWLLLLFVVLLPLPLLLLMLLPFFFAGRGIFSLSKKK